MPGCSMNGCCNRTEGGFSMKSFPREPKRRKIWADKCNRTNWTPTNNSYLCEVHFNNDQWEMRRADGKKKLKPLAIPTTPNNSPKKSSVLKLVAITTPKKSPISVKQLAADHAYTKSSDMLNSTPKSSKIQSTVTPSTAKKNLILKSSAAITIPEVLPISVKQLAIDHAYSKSSDVLNSTSKSSNVRFTLTPNPEKRTLHETFFDHCVKIECSPDIQMSNVVSIPNQMNDDVLSKSLAKKNQLIRILRQKLKLNREKLCAAKKELKNVTKGLNNFLTVNQIQALSKEKKNGFKWSNDTIEKAIKIKLACGSSGYKELINQNCPIPSLRTLRRMMLEKIIP